MDFLLSEEQQLLRDMVERFVKQRYPTAERALLSLPDAGHDAANWSLLAELGLLGLPLDADMGGPVELMILMEALGRGVVAEPVLTEVVMAAGLIARAGTDAQKARWLDAVMAGEAHVALAFAEHETRYDFTLAHCSVQGGRLTGAKTFVIAGEACDAYVVTARGEDGQVGLYLVDARDAGVSAFRYRLIDGSPAVELTFDGVAAEAMAGGAEALAEQVDQVRLAVAAELVGLMQLLFDTTVEYLKVRQQFGWPIGGFQALQHRMADQYLALEQSRSLLYRAALESGEEASKARLAAKSYISAAAVRLGEEAIQMHGGMGVTDEIVVGHAHKRVMLLANLFGDAEVEAERYLALAAACDHVSS